MRISVGLRPAWFTEWVAGQPGLFYRKTLFRKKNEIKKMKSGPALLWFISKLGVFKMLSPMIATGSPMTQDSTFYIVKTEKLLVKWKYKDWVFVTCIMDSEAFHLLIYWKMLQVLLFLIVRIMFITGFQGSQKPQCILCSVRKFSGSIQMFHLRNMTQDNIR